MKNSLILLFLVFTTIASATDYYVSSSGNDTNNGLSASTPWKTIAKVNAAFSILKPSDKILFKRGDTFYGTITITKSGIAGNPITIGAYGTGDNPIITGFTTITGWTNEGNGIYSKVITSDAQTNMVTIDGVNTGMGRYPKSTYLTYESFSTNTSITDNGLGNTINWTGAETVIKKSNYTVDRCLITNHTGDMLSYTSYGTNEYAIADYGYFIQNDLRCVTSYGDWYHNASTGKFYMYFGSVDPNTKVVKIATLNYLIHNIAYSYITIDNISLTGSINHMVYYSNQNNYCIIRNCNLTFAGSNTIRISGSYGTIDNNQISDCPGYAIYDYGSNFTITNNIITNINLIIGQMKGWKEYIGIFYEEGNGTLIQYNTIENVGGFGGIMIGKNANNTIVKNNYINNVSLHMNDCGGIYVSGAHTAVTIDSNVILNVIGSFEGTPNTTLYSEGIYLDFYPGGASGMTIKNNTIANCGNSGIKLHMAHDNIVENNTSFNNYAGIDFENWTGTNYIHGNTIYGNIFFAKAASQFALTFLSVTTDIPSFGTADNNYFARPIADDYIFKTWQPSPGYGYKTLAEWQTFTGMDANSHNSPIAITNNNDIRFEYNASKTNKVIILEQPMIDVKGTKYVNSTTLLPFSSVVLMVDPNPNPAPPINPVYISSVIENANPGLLELVFSLSLASIIPITSAFTVKVNSVNRSVSSVAISGTKVQLTLASPVVYGDIITVDYTKPASNPLQTTSGGIAASISNQKVINNCINIAAIVNQPPVVEISNPLKGDKYQTNSTITLEAFASDPDGSISKVEFHNGAVKLVELTSAPYIYIWKDVKAGAYSITAVAMDNLNAATTSLPLEFEVGTTIKYDAKSEIINLYPNPNDGHFSIEFISPLRNEKSEIIITDLAGKQVYNGPASKEETLKQFDLSNSKSGIYVLMINDKEKLVTKKFIIY